MLAVLLAVAGRKISVCKGHIRGEMTYGSTVHTHKHTHIHTHAASLSDVLAVSVCLDALRCAYVFIYVCVCVSGSV